MSPSFVVNFNDALPPPRYDGVPWTKILIYESATEEGEYALIDTIEMASLPGGIDTEPEEPKYRSFTITNATLTEGWYTFVFEDAAKNESGKTAAIHNAVSVESSIRPSLEDLGALMHVRTVVPGSGGNEIGTFTSETRPTANEAQKLIDNAVNQTLLLIGPNIRKSYWEQTKTVVLYLAAMLLETGFYKNEINKGISAYLDYKELYAEAIDGLTKSINSSTPASATQSYFSIPLVTKQQARFQAIMKAINPQTGLLDPEKLPPDMNYPMGPGGLPAEFYTTAVNAWSPWMWTMFGTGTDGFLSEFG